MSKKKSNSKYERWPEERTQLLHELYGTMDTARLCVRLGVTYGALRSKIKREKLGYQRDADEYITMRQVREIMGIGQYQINRFIEAGLPVFERQFGNGRKNKMISIDKLFKWLTLHQEMWNASKIEYHALGAEPKWLNQKRKLDREINAYKKYNSGKYSIIK